MAPPFLPPANPQERQYWTDPILCEETRARLEYYRSLGRLPPNHKPKILEGIAVVERYCIQFKEEYVYYLLSEDQTIYMNFFDWMDRTFCKKFLQLYDEYWRRLCQYFTLLAERPMNNDVHEQFLNQRFPAERKISRRMKKKNTLDVGVFCILYRHHWVHSRFFRHGSMVLQFATIQLWSSITGTRPDVVLLQKAFLPNNISLGKRKRGLTFQSDIPQYMSANDLLGSVCYRDIELFYLKDPDSNRDVLCAIIEFRNLKGRPEGADGTKFFMHGDYQLSYCPILQIVSYAFRDNTFVNTALSPETIWRLKVPDPLTCLPLRWKPELLDTPLLRHVHRTEYSYELHPSLPIAYASSRDGLRELGRDAKFEEDVVHHNYRRWATNEMLGISFVSNVRFTGNFTSQERQRVLSQSELRQAKREVMEEMRALAGTKTGTKDPVPHLYQQHESFSKDLSQRRKTLAKKTKENTRKDYFYNAPILEVDRQINELLGQADPEDRDGDSPDHRKWELPIPEYIFPERARLVENFYGPDAENFEDNKLLARRIQTTKDMVALSKLCEPNRRGNRVNWDFDGNESEKSEEPLTPKEETLDCPTDVCIICYGLSRRSASNPPLHRFPPKRQDSLRRHLIDCHLANVTAGLAPWLPQAVKAARAGASGTRGT
ncbi:hypothetical protein BGW36DRAFT_360320 [Talaromyces proteolyticus]|uniref:FluG domain-containing protein n=1 Tax=Talaromyces proteolyticus TaxID=1131652 RepID=A0AAD4PZL6_9EURO|nr:uncharacterized protein BGW36DRAFT_360320 [Talaromyces proteolyticus]KAH8696487.1 hypothetical protein BGW36DRAFT_360320 [Talaromyces proteolyticus]